jgi:transcription antitermination factor NusG
MLPLYRSRRQWSDRVRDLELPLFAGYVFCRFVYGERTAVLNTPGVTRIVGFGGQPASIDDREISAIEAVLRSKLPVRPWPHLKPGDRVLVQRGPLRGLEGVLLREKDGLRLVIGVDLLQRSVAVELEPDMIAPSRVFSRERLAC